MWSSFFLEQDQFGNEISTTVVISVAQKEKQRLYERPVAV